MNLFKETLTENQKRYAAFLSLAVLGFLIYSNTLHGPFVFDDYEGILFNPDILSLSYFRDISFTRYFTYLSFFLNHALGGYNTFGYHLVNTLIHIANSILVYQLVTLTMRTHCIRSYKDRVPAEAIAYTASLIFLVHPVQTQAVSYISQRAASLTTLFYLASMLFYIKARLLWGNIRAAKAWAFYAAAVILTAAAQKTKEIGFTLPAIIALYEFIFFDGLKSTLKRIVYLFPFLLTLAIIPLSIYTAKAVPGAVGAGAAGFEGLGGLLREELSTLARYDYLATELRVIVTYLRLMIIPVNQNADYDYPVFHSIFAPQVLLSLIFLAVFFLFAIWLLVRSRKAKDPYGIVASFGILWFFITISVESSIIPISDVIFEHRLYLPSVGVITSFSALLFYLKSRYRLGPFIGAAIAVITLVFSVAAFKRNFVWANELTLWQDVVRKSPNKARGYNNVGFVLAKAGRLDEATGYFEKVTRLKPDYFGAYNNLGEALTEAGKPSEALKYFQMSIRLKPDYWRPYNNLGNALVQLNRPEEAAAYFEKAIRLRPDFPDAYISMGYALVHMKRPEEALKYLKEAVRVRPDSPDARNNTGNALLMLGRVDEAIEEYREALRLDPNHANARINMENALRLRGDLKRKP